MKVKLRDNVARSHCVLVNPIWDLFPADAAEFIGCYISGHCRCRTCRRCRHLPCRGHGRNQPIFILFNNQYNFLFIKLLFIYVQIGPHAPAKIKKK